MKPSEIESYPFEGKMYPYPQKKIYYSLGLSLDILTSPEGPWVNARVVDDAKEQTMKALLATARDFYGKRAKVEIIEEHWIPIFGRMADPNLEQFYPLGEMAASNYFRRYRPRRQRRLRLFGGIRETAPIDSSLPDRYNYTTIARAIGPSGIVAEAKYVTKEVDVPRLP